jgi:hypothetical protein
MTDTFFKTYAVEKYSPDQEREPPGSPEGGRFASEGGSGADKPVKDRITSAIEEVYSKLFPNPLNNQEVGFANKEQTAVVMMQLENYNDSLYVKWMSAYPQKSGMGTQGMNFLKDVARTHNVPLTLTPWARGELGTKKLTRIFKKWGFKAGKQGLLWWHPEDISKYNPNQPREPSGTPEGGRFAGGLKTYQADYRGEQHGQYDPRYFTAEKDILRDEDGKEVARKDKLIPTPVLVERVPADADASLIYRGMSADEYASVLAAGSIKSAGTYNLSSQLGLTYYATDLQAAESYANSFAPTQHKPTFGKPAYVLAVKRPPASQIVNVEGTGSNEVGVNAAIPVSDIVNVWRGEVAAYRPGIKGRGITIAPSARLHWQEITEKYSPSQPRNPKGTPEGGRFRSAGTTAKPKSDGGKRGAEELRTYMEGWGKLGMKNFEWLAEHGQGYEIDENTFIGGKPQMCYMNTFNAVINHPERDLTYVEGYMSVHGVPIHHAFAVTKDGKVRDYTIKKQDVGRIGGYFGVPFKDKYVLGAAMRTKLYGVTTYQNMKHVMEADPGNVVRK